MNDERKNELVVRHVHEHRYPSQRHQSNLPARRQESNDDGTALKAGVVGGIIGAGLALAAIFFCATLDE